MKMAQRVQNTRKLANNRNREYRQHQQQKAEIKKNLLNKVLHFDKIKCSNRKPNKFVSILWVPENDLECAAVGFALYFFFRLRCIQNQREREKEILIRIP